MEVLSEEIVYVYEPERLLKDDKPWYDFVPEANITVIEKWSNHFKSKDIPHLVSLCLKKYRNNRIDRLYTLWIRFKPLNEMGKISCTPREFPFSDDDVISWSVYGRGDSDEQRRSCA